MNDDQIFEMLKDVVAEVDYDIYKALYVKSCIEDEEEAKHSRSILMNIVTKHMKQHGVYINE